MSFVQGRLSNSLPWSVDHTLGNCLRTLYCEPPHTFSELTKLSKDNTRFLPSGRHFDGKGRRSSGGRFSKVAKTFGARKDIRQTPTRFFCKADLFICCKGTKNWNNCRVSCHETPLFWKHRENHVTRNAPVKFRDFRETGPSWKPFCRSPVTGQRRELLDMRTCGHACTLSAVLYPTFSVAGTRTSSLSRILTDSLVLMRSCRLSRERPLSFGVERLFSFAEILTSGSGRWGRHCLLYTSPSPRDA